MREETSPSRAIASAVRAVAQHAETADHGQVVVDGGDGDGDHHHDAGGDARRDDPCRHRAADEVVDAGPVVEDGERPEAEHGEVVAVDRLPQHLRDEIVDSGQADGREPQAEHVVGEPPVDQCLHRAACRLEDEHDLGDRVEPREPEERREQVPLRNVDVLRLAETERDDRPGADEGVGHKQQRRGVGRHLQPLDRGRVTREDADDAEGDAEVPEARGDDEHARMAQLCAGEARHQPERHGEGGVGAPAVNNRVEVRRARAAEGEPLLVAEKLGRVELDRGDQREHRADQQPGQGG